MLHIHNIKPYNRSVQPDVCFRDFFAIVKRPFCFRKMFFCSIEGGKECCYGLFVGFLCGGESGFVDPVVDVVVGPFVCCFYLLLEFFGEEIYILVFFFDEIVKLPALVSAFVLFIRVSSERTSV